MYMEENPDIPLPDESMPETDVGTVHHCVEEEENMNTNEENQTLAQDPLVDNSTLMGMSILTDDNSALQSDDSDNIKLTVSADSSDTQSSQTDSEESEPTPLMETGNFNKNIFIMSHTHLLFYSNYYLQNQL